MEYNTEYVPGATSNGELDSESLENFSGDELEKKSWGAAAASANLSGLYSASTAQYRDP